MDLENKNADLIKALEDLDDRLYLKYKGKLAPIELNVVGGFALLMNKIALSRNEYTDIDYIGESFSEDIKALIEFLNWDFQRLLLETEDYVLDAQTLPLIKEYLKTGTNKLL